MSSLTEAIETLAAEIGDAIYLEVAKWHLYLNDAHLHLPLAEQIYPLLAEDRFDEAALLQVLQNFLVPVGGDRHRISLLNLLPPACQSDLLELLLDYQRKNF